MFQKGLPSGPRTGLCLDAGLLQLERQQLRLVEWNLGRATAPPSSLRGRQLGAQPSRMAFPGGPLALERSQPGGDCAHQDPSRLFE